MPLSPLRIRRRAREPLPGKQDVPREKASFLWGGSLAYLLYYETGFIQLLR